MAAANGWFWSIFGLVSALLVLPATAAVPIYGNGKGVAAMGAVNTVRTSANGPATYVPRPGSFSPEILARDKALGFGFIRLVASPVPLMNSDPDARVAAVAFLSEMVDQARSFNLAVVVDLHFWSSDVPLHQDIVIPDPKLRAALVRGEVALAKRLAHYTDNRVSLELLNEPPCQVAAPNDWSTTQTEMYAQIRKVAPRLPLILTSCRCYYSTLPTFDPSSFARDPNVYWTFHYYQPPIFVEQQQKKLVRVPFPPAPSLAFSPSAIAAMVPSGTPDRASNIRYLIAYLTGFHGQDTVAAQMKAIGDWAGHYRIDPRRIYLGEFAPLLLDTPDARAIRPDQLRWIMAVRQEAERQGFAWAYWGPPGVNNLNYDPQTKSFRSDTLQALGLGHAP